MNDIDRLPEEILWKRLLEATEMVEQYSTALIGRGVNVMNNLELQKSLSRVSMLQKTAMKVPPSEVEDVEQLVMPEFSQSERWTEKILRKLQKAVRRGVAQVQFPVGTRIWDVWTDTANGKMYDMPLRVVDYRKVRLASGEMRLGAILLRENAMPFRVQFDGDDSKNLYGSNRYGCSDVWQWLNSSEVKGRWWKAQHEVDAMPKYARERDGYLRGCSLELRGVMTEITLEVPVKIGTEMVMDKVRSRCFLPSPEDLNVATGTLKPGVCWGYYKWTPTVLEAECAERTFVDAMDREQRCWLQSMHEGRDSYVWTVALDGSIDYNNADGLCSCVVACVVA